MVVAAVASAALFLSVTSFLVWLDQLHGTPAEARLRRMTHGSGPSLIDVPFSQRVVAPVVDGLTRRVMALLPPGFVARISAQLVSAGRVMSTQTFFAVVFLIAALLPSSALIVLLLARNPPSALNLLLILCLATIGGAAPFFWLVRRTRSRRLAIWKSLPDALDLMTICVEGGLGLDAAFRQVSEKLKSPLAGEVSQMLREVGMGRPRREALEDMASRIGVPEVMTFANAIIQAEQLGASLGRVLRAQAFTIRTRRRQRAEEMARKAPAKMVFPLVLCVMPSLFIVVVGPVVVRLYGYLSQ